MKILFFLIFFLKKKISEMKKFREISCEDVLIDDQHFTKSENPDVSIIITVYNQANCFFSCLRSVQNQSLKNIEIIIIDECSLDNITEIIDKYMIEYKRIIYLKHKSNDGKIKSRSDGVRLAKGKNICIIDGDDALTIEYLGKAYNGEYLH
jgi:glycosyltransferase involved in cell wall biosynthesis